LVYLYGVIGEILETSELTDILEFFANNMEFKEPFLAGNIDSMLEIAEIVDSYELDLKTKYYLASAPASIKGNSGKGKTQ
jgi:ATP-dependent RNA helicase SUPV3L1/SUV3